MEKNTEDQDKDLSHGLTELFPNSALKDSKRKCFDKLR